MRWALGWVVLALGCDSLADLTSTSHDSGAPVTGAGGALQAPTSGAGGLAFASSPPTLADDPPAIEPEPQRDWCTVAEREGVTFCERDERTLDYCEPAPAPSPNEGGAAGMAGAEAVAGGDAGAPQGATECAVYERPPFWVYDLLIECAAHCGVAILPSERQLDGSCCYLAWPVYAGR